MHYFSGKGCSESLESMHYCIGILKIKLNAVEDATELVQAAEKCDFDIDLANGRAIVDAKSLLGVISLGTGNILVVQCHGENQDFNKTVQKFAVA